MRRKSTNEISRRSAVQAGEKKMKLTFPIDAAHNNVTVPPDNLPNLPRDPPLVRTSARGRTLQ